MPNVGPLKAALCNHTLTDRPPAPAVTSAYCIQTRVWWYGSFLPPIVTSCHRCLQWLRVKANAIQVRSRAQHGKDTNNIKGDDLFVRRRRRQRSRVRGAMQIHHLTETSVLPLAQCSSMSNKFNNTSFPTSVHIFRSWRVVSEKGVKDLQSLSLCLCSSLRLCSSVCERVCVDQPGALLSSSASAAVWISDAGWAG